MDNGCVILKIQNMKGDYDMFTESAKYTIDSKNRIRIPAVFKAELGSEFALLLGYGCISVYTKAGIEKLIQEAYSNIDPYNIEEMAKFRDFMKLVKFPKEDNQGRFVIDSDFIKSAGLEKEVNIVGMVDHLDIVPYEFTTVKKDEVKATFDYLSALRKRNKNEI